MSIFPQMNLQSENIATAELPIYKEYAYDFENNCLKTRQGNTYLIEKNEALKIWIFKVLNTERFHYLAYSPAFGNESYTLMGQTVKSYITYSELKRFIVEALMVNPYIEELKNFKFEREKSLVRVNYDCTTIYGSMGLTMEWKEVF